MFTEKEIEEMAPLVGEYGYYGEYVYPEEYSTVGYEDEQWMPTDENNDYWVSTYGRIWSAKSQKFLKPKQLDSHGHVGISMYNGKKDVRYRYLHRLMGEAFLPNTEGKPIVRHLNDDPKYNVVDNLAWGTQKDNHRDCVENGHYVPFSDEARAKANKDRIVKTIVTNIRTGEKKVYESLNDAVRATGVQQSNAWKVMNGQRRHSGGFIFERG